MEDELTNNAFQGNAKTNQSNQDTPRTAFDYHIRFLKPGSDENEMEQIAPIGCLCHVVRKDSCEVVGLVLGIGQRYVLGLCIESKVLDLVSSGNYSVSYCRFISKSRSAYSS